MNRASPVELRKCLEAANMLAQSGIRFVPISAATDAEYTALQGLFFNKLEAMAVEEEKAEGGAA
nr:MAG TPA: Protein of unknown function (DUF1382) [Caudoviricetes sp.]